MAAGDRIDLSGSARHLRDWTLNWSRKHWDFAQHLVWNPPGSMSGEGARDRTIHLVPNSAWIAYALLGERGRGDRAEAVLAIERLLDLQYDEPDTPFHGTFARFGEAPHPPEQARIWVDYDPNWRQFVGTTFALVLEDHADRLNADLVRRIERAIALAVSGEPDGRIRATYSNPALMRAWLDAWWGVRSSNPQLVGRGEAFGRLIAAEHDRHGAFEEFNSPTYYGIDLYALRLWAVFPPTEWFARAGARLEAELWRQAARFYNPHLANFCGPFTRSYHPDTTRSVAMFALWIWAVYGPEHAPVPDLDAASIDHCHDLMIGPLVARLAPSADDVGRTDFVTFAGGGAVEQHLARDRRVTAWIERDLMLGAESSDRDWRGWAQFLPVTAHWEEDDGSIGVLWLLDPHVVHAQAHERSIWLDTPGRDELRFRLLAPSARVAPDGSTVQTSAMRVTFGAAAVRCAPKAAGDHELRVTLHPPGTADRDAGLTITFEPIAAI